MRSFSLVCLALVLPACSQLIVRDDDTAVQKTAKVTARVVMVVPTVGISEAAIAEIKEREAYEAWRKRGVPEPVSPEQWQAYLFDQQLLRLAELFPDLIIASWMGDYISISAGMLNAAALLANDDKTPPENERYPPPPLHRWNKAYNDLPRLPCKIPGPCAMP